MENLTSLHSLESEVVEGGVTTRTSPRCQSEMFSRDNGVLLKAGLDEALIYLQTLQKKQWRTYRTPTSLSRPRSAIRESHAARSY